VVNDASGLPSFLPPPPPLLLLPRPLALEEARPIDALASASTRMAALAAGDSGCSPQIWRKGGGEQHQNKGATRTHQQQGEKRKRRP
jgi:hypothetical protein